MGFTTSATKRLLWFVLLCLTAVCVVTREEQDARRKHAYVAMMYMGTPRDYEFYVATRVMMRSLARLGVDADRVVLASVDVPTRWVYAMSVLSIIYLLFIQLVCCLEACLGGLIVLFDLLWFQTSYFWGFELMNCN